MAVIVSVTLSRRGAVTQKSTKSVEKLYTGYIIYDSHMPLPGKILLINVAYYFIFMHVSTKTPNGTYFRFLLSKISKNCAKSALFRFGSPEKCLI